MATRLYPATSNARILEILADVPAGTMAKLTKFKAMSDGEFGDSDVLGAIARARRAAYQADPGAPSPRNNWTVQQHIEDLRADFRDDPSYVRYLYMSYILPAVARLDSFLSSGWGRVQADAAYLTSTRPRNDSYVGRVTELSDVRYILGRQLPWLSHDELWFDPRSWLGTLDNCKVCTRSGSVFLSELEGLYWA